MRVKKGKPRYSVDCYHCVLTVGLHNQFFFAKSEYWKSEAISAGFKGVL